MVSKPRLVITFLCLALFAGCAHTPAKKQDARPSLLSAADFQVRRKVLSNGLTVLMVEDRTVPVVSYSTWIRAGSAWDPPNATGIAHLFEHMMFKGTPKYSGKAFFTNLESRGATVNAYTQKDATVYYEYIAPEHLELVIDMESDRLANLTIDEKQLESERAVVKEERRLRVGSDFGAQQMEELLRLAYPAHPYGWPVIGYEQDLNTISLEQCLTFFRSYYQPTNAIVTIAGNFDADKVEGWLEKYYGSIPGRPVQPLSPPQQPKQEGEVRKTLSRPVEAEGILLAYHIPEVGHPDIPALSVLSWVMFGMTSSRATEALVREKQVAVSVNGYVDQSKFPGLFFMSADLRAGVPAEAVLRELDKLIHEVKTSPITQVELDRVKARLSLSVAGETKSPFSLASWLAAGEFYYNDYQKVFEKLEQYRALTTADLLRVARMYLNRDNRVIVTLKPEEKRAAQ